MKIFKASIVLFLSFVIYQANSQEDSVKTQDPIFLLGPYIAYNYNLHLTSFDGLPGIPSCCPKFESGTGAGFTAGAHFEMPISGNLFFETRLAFSSLGAELTKDETFANYRVQAADDPNNDYTTDVTVTHILDSKILAAGLEPGVNFKFFDRAYSALGIKLAYVINGAFDQKEQLIKPNDVVFRDGRLIQNDYYDTEIPDLNTFQLFGFLGAGYDIPVGNSLIISPEIRAQIPFTDISSFKSAPEKGSWKAATIQFGAAIKFPVYEKTYEDIYETIYERDTVTVAVFGIDEEKVSLIDSREEYYKGNIGEDIVYRTVIYEKYKKEVPKIVDITADLEAWGLTKEGERIENPTITIEETETTEGFPLLPYVFFEQGEYDLKRTAMNRIDKSETSNFDEDSVDWNALDIYSDLLNIVGSRLRQNPDAKITLVGCNSDFGPEEDNVELSELRALAVKNYFEKVWEVDESRIEVNSRNLPEVPSNTGIPEGRAENRRVEIHSDDFQIVEPVNLSSILRESSPARVEILPKASSEAGLTDWSVTVSQNGNPLKVFSGEGEPEGRFWDVLEEPSPRVESPVDITLVADDSLGQTTSAEKSLDIKQLTIRKKRVELKDDKRIERFSLILFDFDKATIKPQHRRVLDDIKGRIKPDSKVTIKGYADRIGEREYNKELAARRCESVEKFLQVPEGNLDLEPIGSDLLLYDNSIPQGRNYSRTVQIIIETPVNK